MREQRQIVERWHQGSAMILITLARVQGSSYRQPGARLLVCSDGTYVGGISAGCLEADLLRKASWLIRNGSVIERYSTLFEESTEIPFGLGCGGVLDILLEPAGTPECQALLKAIESALSGREHLVATWPPTPDSGMMRAVFRADGELVFSSEGLSSESLTQVRIKCLHHPDLEVGEVFVERLVPPQRLIVFGAGDDAKPLVTMASLLGWRITVVDGRGRLASKSRFPENNVEVTTDIKSAIHKLNSRDAVVIMTHSYEQDSDYLTSALPLRPSYLGLLGSRQRSSLLIAGAAAKLDMSVSECCEYICAPIGFDIGGEGPEVIALAILAEAQACSTGKGTSSRKLSAEHVQRSLSDSKSQIYAQAQCALDTV